MSRKAEGRVDRFRDKYRARLAGKHLGLFDTEAEAHAIVDAALARRTEKEPDTCRALAKTWFTAREESGIVELIKPQISDWNARVDIKEAKWLDMPPRLVRPVHLQRWLNALAKRNAFDTLTRKVDGKRVVERRDRGERLSHESVTKAMSLVKLYFDWLRSEGKIEGENPARHLIMPVKKRPPRKGDQRIVHLYPNEIERLFALDMPPMVRAVYAVAVYCGLRRAEIWGLLWEHIEFDGSKPFIRVRFSYGGDVKSDTSVREVPLLPFPRACLQAYRASLPALPLRGTVFPSASGGIRSRHDDCGWRDRRFTPGWTDAQGTRHALRTQPWDRSSPRVTGVRVQPGWRSKAEIRPEVTFQCLRHTCGSHLVQGTLLGNAARLELHDVCSWLGHSSIKVTERHYADLAPGNLHDKAHGFGPSNVARESGTPEKPKGRK